MGIEDIRAKTVLRRAKRVDSWFLSRYGMNLYRGCAHDCAYCDGRAERYGVEGDFGRDIGVKVNALDILGRELDSRRRRVPLRRGFILLGGGVGDSYQPEEKKLGLTRSVLELLEGLDFGVHILTKSVLIVRDLDILKRINRRSRVIVSMSISSTDPAASARFEPGVPPPAERLALLSQFKKEGLPVGVFLMPVIPRVTDDPPHIRRAIEDAGAAGVDFLQFGGMTLKPGRQRTHFWGVLDRFDPELKRELETLYGEDPWGQPDRLYAAALHTRFADTILRSRIPSRIPLRLFRGILDPSDLVAVLLEHIDYLLRLRGRPSGYGAAARALGRAGQPISTIRNPLALDGVGRAAAAAVREILDTGSCALYESLIAAGPIRRSSPPGG